MASRRMLKAAEAIREVVSMSILTEIRDPRVQYVTVTGVEVSPDMRNAKVMVSVMGDDGRQQLSLRGLENARGFLQSKIAKRIETRYTPRLAFELDQGVKKSIEVGRILQQIEQERQQDRSESVDADERIDVSDDAEPPVDYRQEGADASNPDASNPDASNPDASNPESASNPRPLDPNTPPH